MFLFRQRIDKDSQYSDPDRLQEIIRSHEPHCLIDVRTTDEYESGHIPTARLIPHREITTRPPTADKEMLIILYCASGARSNQAKRRLTAEGYGNIVNFGGINRWNGEMHYGPAEAER